MCLHFNLFDDENPPCMRVLKKYSTIELFRINDLCIKDFLFTFSFSNFKFLQYISFVLIQIVMLK